MYTVSKEFDFSAAHRIEGHPKCGRLHGHNYTVIVEVAERILPSDGMLLDYGIIKEIAKPLIDAMDHRYIVSISNMNARDPYALMALAKDEAYELGELASTAEFIAKSLSEQIEEALEKRFPDNDFEISVEVQETPKTSACYWR
jgi:6-pyruvoyl tetrahydropterin synthase/QueD family protein